MKKLIVTLSLMVSLISVSAQPEMKLPVDTAVVHGVLPNGLTYYIRHNEYPADRAGFYLAQKVGATLEEDNQNGLAHFLEHMAFNGTKNFPDKGIIDYMEKQGVKFGANINAFTSMDVTVYHLSNVPTTRDAVVDSALLVLHDWSGFITLDSEEIDKERGVILEEWRTGRTASRRTKFTHKRNTMAGTRYAERDVIGDTAVINNFKCEELRAYYQKWYRPDLQGVIVVGDIDPKAVEQKIIELWSDIPAKENAAERVYFQVPNNEKPIVSIVRDEETKYTNVSVSFRQDPMSKEMKNSVPGYIMKTMLNVLTKAVNTRLNDICRKADAPILAGAYSYGEEVATKDAFTFAVVNKNGQMAKAYELLLDEIEKLRRYGLTYGEFERAMDNLVKDYEDAYNSRAKRLSDSYCREYYSSFLNDEPIPGIEVEYEVVKMLKQRFTAESVNKAIPLFFKENIVIKISAREDEELLSEEQMLAMLDSVKSKELVKYEDERFDEPLVAELPKAATIKKKKVRDDLFGVTEWTLSNGIKVMLLPTDYTDDEIIMSAFSKGGYSLMSEDEVLNAAYTTSFVNEYGLGKYSDSQLRKMLSGKSAGVSSSLSLYSESLIGSSTKSDFETLMQLTYLSFGAPREDKEAFDVVMEMLNTTLKNRSKDPNAVYNDTITSMLREKSAYAPILSLENINELNYEKTLEIYEERFKNPGDFTFLFIGDFEIDTIKPHILTYIGGLSTTKDREEIKDRDIRIRKGKHRKEFAIDMITPKLSSFTLYSGEIEYSLANNLRFGILDELLTMRYLDTIREDEGGSYGVGVASSVSINPNQYLLQVVFDTDEEKFEKLYKIVKDEIQQIADKGCDLEDLAKIKENMIKKHAEDVKRNGHWRGVITTKMMYGFDNHTDYVKTVESVTSEEIQAIVKKMLSDGNLIEVVMRSK